MIWRVSLTGAGLAVIPLRVLLFSALFLACAPCFLAFFSCVSFSPWPAASSLTSSDSLSGHLPTFGCPSGESGGRLSTGPESVPLHSTRLQNRVMAVDPRCDIYASHTLLSRAISRLPDGASHRAGVDIRLIQLCTGRARATASTIVSRLLL